MGQQKTLSTELINTDHHKDQNHLTHHTTNETKIWLITFDSQQKKTLQK